MPSFLWACCCRRECTSFGIPLPPRITPSGYALSYASDGVTAWSFAYEGDAWGTHEWERSKDRARVGGHQSNCKVLFAWKGLVYAAGALDPSHVGQSADYKVKTIRDGQLPTAGGTYGRYGHDFVNTTGYFETGDGSGVPLDFEPYAWPACNLGGYALADTACDPKADELDARMDGGPRTLGLTGTFTFLALFGLRSTAVRWSSGYTGSTGVPNGTVLVSPEDGRKDLILGRWYPS